MTDVKNVIKELEAVGIHDVKEVVYNPSYEQLFEEETKPGLEGFEKGTLTTTGAVAVDVNAPSRNFRKRLIYQVLSNSSGAST